MNAVSLDMLNRILDNCRNSEPIFAIRQAFSASGDLIEVTRQFPTSLTPVTIEDFALIAFYHYAWFMSGQLVTGSAKRYHASAFTRAYYQAMGYR